jgi:hypothetical protein
VRGANMHHCILSCCPGEPMHCFPCKPVVCISTRRCDSAQVIAYMA